MASDTPLQLHWCRRLIKLVVTFHFDVDALTLTWYSDSDAAWRWCSGSDAGSGVDALTLVLVL